MESHPLLILIGPENEAVLYAKDLIAGLTSFELDIASHTVKTRFECINCFPRVSGHSISDYTPYPLRISVGDYVTDTFVSLNGESVGNLLAVQVKLSTAQKRIVRITSHIPFPDELNTALLDLDVEIIVQPPDSTQSVEGTNACL